MRIPNDPAIVRMELSNKMSQQDSQAQFPWPVMAQAHVAPIANQVTGVGPGEYNSLGGLVDSVGVPRGQMPQGAPSSWRGQFVLPQQMNRFSNKGATAEKGVQVNLGLESMNFYDLHRNNEQNQQQGRRDAGRVEGQGSHDNRVSNIYSTLVFITQTEHNETIISTVIIIIRVRPNGHETTSSTETMEIIMSAVVDVNHHSKYVST